jgi:hypothetical protein
MTPFFLLATQEKFDMSTTQEKNLLSPLSFFLNIIIHIFEEFKYNYNLTTITIIIKEKQKKIVVFTQAIREKLTKKNKITHTL